MQMIIQFVCKISIDKNERKSEYRNTAYRFKSHFKITA